MDRAAIDRLAQVHASQQPFYVRFCLSEAEVNAAERLQEIVASAFKRPRNYRHFFCSSGEEAFSAAIKLSRMGLTDKKSGRGGQTVCWDPEFRLQHRLDPVGAAGLTPLIPAIHYVSSIEDTFGALQDPTFGSVLISGDGLDQQESIESLVAVCGKQNIKTILDLTGLHPVRGWPGLTSLSPPDILCFGSNLTDDRAPAGCVLMSRQAFAPWDRFATYNLHSNTWGGNSASVSLIDLTLPAASVDHSGNSGQPAADTDQPDHSFGKTEKRYARYLNGKMVSMMRLGAMSKPVRFAHHCRAGGADDFTVIDASGTFGVNLRGHTPDDIPESLFQRHDPDHDYAAELEQFLGARTDLPYFFQATSGATSNDTAIALAMLAQFPRKEIIALTSGFHGKTCISLSVTHKSRIRTPFQPLYQSVTFLDIRSDDFQTTFSNIASRGDLAVVILEPIQGEGGVLACPQHQLDFIAASRHDYGFLMIADEVQTGLHRTGHFLNLLGKGIQPDLVSIGKGLSGMVFPIAGALASESVFSSAIGTNANAVASLYSRYRCQFGAHCGLHTLRQAEHERLSDRAAVLGKQLLDGIAELARKYPLIGDIRGEGLMIGIEINPQMAPIGFRGSAGGMLASRLANDPVQPVATAFTPDKPNLIRLLPPLTISEQEIQLILETLRRALGTPWPKLIAPFLVRAAQPRVWFPKWFS